MAEKTKKQKKPTALKRIKQSEKRNLRNRQIKSKIKTAINDLKTAISKKEELAIVSKKLNAIYSLSDKAVKKNIITKNKSNRIKSQYALKIQK